MAVPQMMPVVVGPTAADRLIEAQIVELAARTKLWEMATAAFGLLADEMREKNEQQKRPRR